MRSKIYKLLCLTIAAVLTFMTLTLGAAADMSFRSGGMSRSSEELADQTADESGIVHEPDTEPGDMGTDRNDTNTDRNNMNTDSAPGTGEFANDTSNNTLESAIDNTVTDAENAVTDAANGIGVWGVVIAIAIVAVLAIILFAFLGRRK